jgi:hypothetical protein
MPAIAHHSFAAEFDSTKQVTLEGKVKEFRWVNPHSWLHINVEKATIRDTRTNTEEVRDGKVEEWAVEGGAPSALLRRGWTRDTLPAGTTVVVRGSMSNDGKLRANASNIAFPDGTSLCAASSNDADTCEDVRPQ